MSSLALYFGNGASVDNLLENFDVLQKIAEPRTTVNAMHLIKRSHAVQREIRKTSKMKPQIEERECPHCKAILLCNERSCSKCATVLELTWLQMPTEAEMRYKLQTHQFPCSYKRINHFNEKLAQLQGKERTQIPNSVFVSIRMELEKTHTGIETLTPLHTRKILRKLSMARYYEHSNFITSRLNGFALPCLPFGEEEILRKMFFSIQAPFFKFAPTTRKNFLNYAYCFRKFLELRNYDWLLTYFSLLKSRDKLAEQDRIWERICIELEWQFIPSL